MPTELAFNNNPALVNPLPLVERSPSPKITTEAPTASVTTQSKPNAIPQFPDWTQSPLFSPAKDEMNFQNASTGYVERQLGDKTTVPLGNSGLQIIDSGLSWSTWEAGYGRLFSPEPVASRGRNGAAWEDSNSFVYLKFNRSF